MIKVGNTVQCRFYNTPDKRFYGDTFTGKVLEIRRTATNKPEFLISSPMLSYAMWLHRKEIKRIIK